MNPGIPVKRREMNSRAGGCRSPGVFGVFGGHCLEMVAVFLLLEIASTSCLWTLPEEKGSGVARI